MAELITTDAEKASPAYLDWDDASLGRFARYVALKLEEVCENDVDGFARTLVAGCTAILVDRCVETNSESLELDITDHKRHGELTGNWKITVERNPPEQGTE